MRSGDELDVGTYPGDEGSAYLRKHLSVSHRRQSTGFDLEVAFRQVDVSERVNDAETAVG